MWKWALALKLKGQGYKWNCTKHAINENIILGIKKTTATRTNKIIFIACRNKQRGRQDRGRSPPDAARRLERVGKNKGELSDLRRANSDVADNETSAHD